MLFDAEYCHYLDEGYAGYSYPLAGFRLISVEVTKTLAHKRYERHTLRLSDECETYLSRFGPMTRASSGCHPVWLNSDYVAKLYYCPLQLATAKAKQLILAVDFSLGRKKSTLRLD